MAAFMSTRAQARKPAKSQAPSLVEALRDCAGCAAFVVSHNETITSCAPDAERLLQFEPGHAAKKRSFSFLPPALQQIIREAAATHRPVTNRSLTPLSAKNLTGTLQVSAVPVQSNTGKPQVVVVLNDFSVSRRLEQTLRRLDRLAGFGTLSASMAHEIKNALVSVKTFVDLLLEKNRDAELAEVVGRELRRINSIVGQMLKYTGPARPAFSSVRLHDVLDHSLRMVQPQIEGRLISLNRVFHATPDAIEGDDYQLEQAFVNLLLNAIEAMGTNGSLTVATELISAVSARAKAGSVSGAHVRVAIADTGIGITTENMPRLFEPFFTTKQQGTGLGLTIARRIVQEHRGDISVQSQLNKGTTFSILLPARRKDEG
ncbi:MAG: ATP-binding protein [Verrucomicrobia bacterium]|nr:ATP-binding protein [Verrucomicrobiota bacterium]